MKHESEALTLIMRRYLFPDSLVSFLGVRTLRGYTSTVNAFTRISCSGQSYTLLQHLDGRKRLARRTT